MDNGDVLAMGSWSLVNVSLNSTYKKMLMYLGGIELILDAIDKHPVHTEVVYRCLFALINIVIPPSANDEGVDPASVAQVQELLGGTGQSQSEIQVRSGEKRKARGEATSSGARTTPSLRRDSLRSSLSRR